MHAYGEIVKEYVSVGGEVEKEADQAWDFRWPQVDAPIKLPGDHRCGSGFAYRAEI